MSDTKTYTADEVDHLVAREVAKQRMSDIETHVKNLEVSTNKSYSKVEAKLESIGELIISYSSHVDQCREEIKKEIAEDYVPLKIFQLEITRLETRIYELWIRISIAVTVGVAIVQFLVGHFIK